MKERRVPGDVSAVFGLVIALVLIAVIAQNSGVGLTVTFLCFPLVVYALMRAPVGVSMMTLMFFALVLENPEENPAAGTYMSPFFTVGAVMLTHLNAVDRSLSFISWCPFSGMDLCLMTLGIVVAVRGKPPGAVGSPIPMIRLAQVSLLGTLWGELFGILRGGDFGMSLWQLNRVVYLPCIFLLFHSGLRGPKDVGALAKVVLAAAVTRSLFAMYVYHVVTRAPDNPTGTPPAHATSHHDSMLFALAYVIIAACFVERVRGSIRKAAIVVLPIVAGGIYANNRRMAWVQVACVLAAVYLMTPDNPVKRALRKGLKVSAPFIALYLAAGWNSSSSIFKPVRIMHSIVDAKSDASSFWREMENFNLVFTLRQNPILGSGYGHPYIEVVKLPEVPYLLEYYAPHNSVLGIWAFCGLVGWTTLTALWGTGVFLSVRALHAATTPEVKAAAHVAYGMVLIYLLQCWGDMGLGSWGGVFMTGAALATGAKLAVATGAWGAPGKSQPVAGNRPGSAAAHAA